MSEVPPALPTNLAKGSPDGLPYKLACLCDLRDARGRVLLIRRKKSPNLGLCSPIGGKLDMHTGESPAQCAQREILEEAGIHVPLDRLHLGGLIAETAFEGEGHWLLFYYRVLGPVEVEERDMREGRLEWFEHDAIADLPLPETDRQVIWPLIRANEGPAARGGDPHGRPGFFVVHIDCRDGRLTWTVDQEMRG
jgi:8-oxo-dGTP diphosphatase